MSSVEEVLEVEIKAAQEYPFARTKILRVRGATPARNSAASHHLIYYLEVELILIYAKIEFVMLLIIHLVETTFKYCFE